MSIAKRKARRSGPNYLIFKAYAPGEAYMPNGSDVPNE